MGAARNEMLNGFSTDPLTLTQWVLVQQQKEVRHLSAAVQYPKHLALIQTCVYPSKLQTDDQRCAGSTCSRQPVNTPECDMCSMQICGLGSAQGTLVLHVNLCMLLPRLVSHSGRLCNVSDNACLHAQLPSIDCLPCAGRAVRPAWPRRHRQHPGKLEHWAHHDSLCCKWLKHSLTLHAEQVQL